MKIRTSFHGLASLSVATVLFLPTASLLGQTVPEVVSARGLDNRVQVVFSVPVQAAGATNPANYSLTNLYSKVEVLQATLGTNGQTIQLTTARQFPFMEHRLSISGIIDALSGTNAIAPDSQVTFTNIAFTTGYSMTEIYRGIAGTTISTLTNSANYPGAPKPNLLFSLFLLDRLGGGRQLWRPALRDPGASSQW